MHSGSELHTNTNITSSETEIYKFISVKENKENRIMHHYLIF